MTNLRTLVKRAVNKHLAGGHDQSSHGRRGITPETVTSTFVANMGRVIADDESVRVGSVTPGGRRIHYSDAQQTRAMAEKGVDPAAARYIASDLVAGTGRDPKAYDLEEFVSRFFEKYRKQDDMIRGGGDHPDPAISFDNDYTYNERLSFWSKTFSSELNDWLAGTDFVAAP